MKVHTGIIIAVCLLLGTVTATPLARVFEEDSPYIRRINDLSTAAGILPLSASPPLTGYDLKRKLDSLKQQAYGSSSVQSAISQIEDELFAEEETYIGSFITLSPEFYANLDDQAREWEWVERYADRAPILSVQAETIFADHLFGIFTYGIEKRLNSEDFQGPNFSFPYSENTSETNLQNSFPQTAYMAYASEHVTTAFGRDTLSWGQGNTGNLVIGSHVPYHDFFLASASNAVLKYSFLTVPMNELDASGEAVIPSTAAESDYWNALFHGTNMRIAIAHRLEAEFSPRLRISLTEWTMHYADRLDIRMLSPVMLLHNYQNFGEVNNTITLEIESALSQGLLLDFQFFLDQFQTTGELEAYADAPPAAYAALLGLKYVHQTDKGSLSGYLEGVYTSPFVYLRAGDHTENYGEEGTEETMYNLDFVHAVNMRYGDGSVNFLGYLYGPDSIVAAVKLAYTRHGLYKIFGDLRYIAQGERGLIVEGDDQSMEFGSDTMNMISPSGIPTYRLIIGAGGSYSIHSIPVTLYGNTYFTNTWYDGGYSHDVQLSLGARYTLSIF